MNWRKQIVYGLLNAKGSPITKELAFLRSIEWSSAEEIRKVQDRRLARLLLHAWEKTEYYRDVLSECGVVRNGEVNLDRFEDIPFLTKDIIRIESMKLKAEIVPTGQGRYPNFSGGSTGEPLEFWQDNYYNAVNIATKLYHFEMLGKQLGEPEMKIWGSEKDLREGTIGLSAKLQNFLYNRLFQNCTRLSEEDIRSIIRKIDQYKPKIIWCYRDGMDVIANYVNRHGLRPHSPAAILCGGGTLYHHIEEAIEKAFSAPVINFYGSREMGDIACQCLDKAGLHISAHSHMVETVGRKGESVLEEDGELVITSLTNYTMPFIRYKIGDRGSLTTKSCPCGRGFPLLESVSGRVMDTLINSKGEHVDPIYFTPGGNYKERVFCPELIERYQIVQEDYSRIRFRMVLRPGADRQDIEPNLKDITSMIRLVMGNDCEVIFDFVDEIPLTRSGKHMYIVRNIPPTEVGSHE